MLDFDFYRPASALKFWRNFSPKTEKFSHTFLILRARPAPHQFFQKTLTKKNEAEGESENNLSVSLCFVRIGAGVFQIWKGNFSVLEFREFETAEAGLQNFNIG